MYNWKKIASLTHVNSKAYYLDPSPLTLKEEEDIKNIFLWKVVRCLMHAMVCITCTLDISITQTLPQDLNLDLT
jgi:hypothetical protein